MVQLMEGMLACFSYVTDYITIKDLPMSIIKLIFTTPTFNF